MKKRRILRQKQVFTGGGRGLVWSPSLFSPATDELYIIGVQDRRCTSAFADNVISVDENIDGSEPETTYGRKGWIGVINSGERF